MLPKRAALLLFVVGVTTLPSSAVSNGNNPHGFHQASTFGTSAFGPAFGASENAPVVQTKTTYNGCSSRTGCGGLTLENGQVTHQYGNPAAIGIQGSAPLNPTELHSKFAQQAADINSAFGAPIPANGPFWWTGPDSPFKDAHEAYMKWIKDGFNGIQIPSPCAICALSNSLANDNKVVNTGVLNSNDIDAMIQRNPFLNGQFASSFNEQSSGSKDTSVHNTQYPAFPTIQTTVDSSTGFSNLNIANNPFLNGAISSSSSGCSGGVGAGCGQSNGVIHQSGSVNQHVIPSQPPTGSAGCGGVPGGCNFQSQSQTTGNQFVQQQQQTTCTGSYCGQQPVKPPSRDTSLPHPQGSTVGGFVGETGKVTGELTVSCSGQNSVCVDKYLCVNGFVGEEHKSRTRGGGGVQCKTSTEACCKLRPSKNTISVQGNLIDSSSLQSSLSSNVVTTGGSSVNYLTPTQQTSGVTFISGTQDHNSNDFSNFGQTTIDQNSFFTRPGTGAVLKPGIPYLPPVEQPKTTPRPTPTVYIPPSTRPTPRPTIYVPPPTKATPRPTVYVPPTTRATPRPTVYVPPTTRPTPRPTVYVPPTPRPTPPKIYTTPKPYLPPKEDERPQSSIGSQQIVPGPRPDSEGSLLLDNTRFPPAKDIPHIPNACAAALKCTPIEFCTAEGVISNTTVQLSQDQAAFRVPLTDCKEPTTGVLGKCCRDPTYTDPWPTNQLGQWVPGAFGDTGAYKGEVNRNGGGNGNGNGRKPVGRPTGNNPTVISGGAINLGASGSVNTPIFTSNPNNPVRPQNNFPNTGNTGVKIPVKTPVKTPIKTPTQQQFQQSTTHTQNVVPQINGNQFIADSPTYTSGQLQLSNFNNYNTGGSCGIRRSGVPPGNKEQFEADFGEIPWQAMILLETNRSLLCGGVITAPDVVVTSAHCIDGIAAKNILIKGGEWKLGVDDEPKTFQIVQVSRVIKHPAYQPGNLQYDIAVLLLAEKLRFAEHINSICLPPQGQSDQRLYNRQTQCIVTGWGKQVLQVHIPNSIMHSLDMSLIPPNQCQAQIQQNYPHLLEQYNSNTCVCGQPSNVAANICKVDIGSALACTNGNGVYYMEGVYSWDSGCTSQNQIASFFKFDSQWYESTMESVSSQSQIYETYDNSKQYQQNSQVQNYKVTAPSGFGGLSVHSQLQAPKENKSYAITGEKAFHQAIGHTHTGPQCHCLENGKKK